MCRWGKFVAHHPWPVIGTTFTITTLCSLGFLLFRFIIINIFSSIIFTCFPGSSMLLTSYGYPPLHHSNLTKNGRTHISRRTPAMRTSCSVGRTSSPRQGCSRWCCPTLLSSFYQLPYYLLDVPSPRTSHAVSDQRFNISRHVLQVCNFTTHRLVLEIVQV